MIIYTLENINDLQKKFSIVYKAKVMGSNNKNKYVLLKPLRFKLSNNYIITIPKGFIWDGSSTPRIFWSIVPPDGDFEIGALIHDYLYVNKKKLNFKRKFADKEMLIWSDKVSGTKNISIRNIDNYIRYFFVRLFGGFVWKDIIKIK